MGFLTLLFNGFCELVGSFFKIILFFVVLILGSIAFGKFGNAHKLKDGYFECKYKSYETREKGKIEFLNDNKCIINHITYKYEITKYLYSEKTNIIGVELSLVYNDTKTLKQKTFRLVRADRIPRKGYLKSFIQGKQIQVNPENAQEVFVNNSKDPETISTYKILEELLRTKIMTYKFIGYLQLKEAEV